jgi:hypothetical protein
MARVQCNCCLGEFDQALPDRMQYFHVCPPLSLTELGQAVTDGRVVLPPGETGADAIARRVYVRACARDENVVLQNDPTQPARIKAVGRGVRVLPPVPAPGPVIVPDA